MDLVEDFPFITKAFFRGRQRSLRNDHAGSASQKLYRLRKGKTFHPHDKTDCITADATTETVINSFCRVHIKRWSFL